MRLGVRYNLALGDLRLTVGGAIQDTAREDYSVADATMPEVVYIPLGGAETAQGGVFYHEGDIDHAPEIVMSVETLERLWLGLQVVRRAAGDLRRVCPDHGFWSVGLCETCPACKREELAADAAERLRASKDTP